MSERIITLFGEEIVPEQIKAVGKSRAKKAPQEKIKEEKAKEENKEDSEKPKKEEIQNIILPEDWSGDKQYY